MFNDNQEQTCPSVAYQMSTVCVPVTVTPFARAGATVTKCCGANSCHARKSGVTALKTAHACLPSVRTSVFRYL